MPIPLLPPVPAAGTSPPAPAPGPLGTLSLFVLWDRDPGGGVGIIHGDESTMENLTGWAAAGGTTISPYTANPHSGTQSMLLTRTGSSGVAQATLSGKPASAGRTYLLWVHALAVAASRFAQTVITWKNGATVLSTVTTTGADTAGSWVGGRIGTVATAPAGTTNADITVLFLFCNAAEGHAVDTVTMDDVGVDESGRLLSATPSRGRSDELDTVQAGSGALLLGNRDGALTGTGGASAPYAGNVVPNRRVVLLASVGGMLYPRWVGYTSGYTQTINMSWSEVTLACTDAFRTLGRRPIPPPYRAEVLLIDKPDTYLPLDEAVGASGAGNLSGTGGAAPLLVTKYGTGGTAFGATPVLPVTNAGHTADDDATSLSFNPTAGAGGTADVLDVSALPSTWATMIGAWTFEFWLSVPTSPAATGIIYRSGLASNNNALTGFQIEYSTIGRVVVKTASETCVTSAFSYSGAGARLFRVTYDPSAGTFGTVRLRIYGTEDISYACAFSPFPFAILPTAAYVGAAWQTLTRVATFPFVGRLANLAWWSRLLADSRQDAHGAVGLFGGTLETEGNRIGGVLTLAGWPAEDTKVDAGLTQLLGRAWSDTNGLALPQQVAAQASATVLMDSLGKVAMQSRRRRINAPSVATFAASAGTGAEVDYAPTLDDSRLQNVVAYARVGGASVTITVPASITRYDRVATGQTTTLGITSDAEMTTAAQYQALRYATPDVRVAQVSFRLDAATAPALLTQLLGLEQGDKITLAELPVLAPASSVDYFVERIADSWKSWQWTVTLGLSPVSAVPGVHTAIQLNSATYGVLDSTNALTY